MTSEEEIADRLKRIEEVIEKKKYAHATEGIKRRWPEDISKLEEVIKKEKNEMAVFISNVKREK